MKITNLTESSTTAGAVAPVSVPFKSVQKREAATVKGKGSLFKGIQSSKKYPNSISEGRFTFTHATGCPHNYGHDCECGEKTPTHSGDCPWRTRGGDCTCGYEEYVASKGISESTNPWNGIGFDVRSDQLWPAKMFESTEPGKSFSAWINDYKKQLKTPESGTKCILAMINKTDDKLSVYYGYAEYAGEESGHYILKIKSGTHRYSKSNQLVFSTTREFEHFKTILGLQFGEQEISVEKMPVMESADAVQKEGIGDAIKRGVKRVKRGMQGWDTSHPDLLGTLDGDHSDSPRNLVKRNKGYDDATVKSLSGIEGKGPPHSPSGLQQRVLDREMKKRGLLQHRINVEPRLKENQYNTEVKEAPSTLADCIKQQRHVADLHRAEMAKPEKDIARIVSLEDGLRYWQHKIDQFNDEPAHANIAEKAVSKNQQQFFGMAHAIQKGEKVKGASKELQKAAKTMSKKDVKDFAQTKHKGLPTKVAEAEIQENDLVLTPGKGRQHKPGLLNKPEVSVNPTDVVKLDVPLLIRLLEFSKEDAQSDMDLHDLAEKLVAGSARGRTLTMKDYDSLIPEVKPQQAEPEVAESTSPDDGIYMGAKVYHAEHQSGEPFKVVKIIDDQRVGVIDEYGNKQVMFINQLVPAQQEIDEAPTRNTNLPPLRLSADKVKPASDAITNSLRRAQERDDIGEDRPWVTYSNAQNVHRFNTYEQAVAAQKKFGPNYKIASADWFDKKFGTEVEEGIGDAIKRGAKYVKRGMQGWGVTHTTDLDGNNGGPKGIVNRNKGYDDETVKSLSNFKQKISTVRPDSPHSPSGLQQRVLDREMKKRGLGEADKGRFVRGPDDSGNIVDYDRQGKPKAPKPAKVPTVRGPRKDVNGMTRSDYDTVWRKIEDVVGQIFPDGDPIDWMAPWLKRNGAEEFKIGDILDKACKLNGYSDMYEYYDSMKTGDYGYDEQVNEVSADTLASYKQKANFDARGAHSRLNSFEPGIRTTPGDASHEADKKLLRKRTSGIAAAQRKGNM